MPQSCPQSASRRRRASVAMVAVLGCLLGGCSIPVADLPIVGLPAGAPTRPAEPGVYPAVHDMPAARTEPTLDPADQAKMETDLIHARDRQAAVAGRPAKAQDKASDQQGN
ncbi:MAG: hypothetical protein P4M07_23265 [Xanthobacteraceae bacterium]|nr:hypothetical protein [Xanthobacteraceae bacterium]